MAEFEGKQDLRTKVMIALFGLFAEMKRDMISERTKEGLAAAKAKGERLGRPKVALGTSRLDGKEQRRYWFSSSLFWTSRTKGDGFAPVYIM